jgi:hypothetical protein
MAAPLKVGPAAGDTHSNVVKCPHCGQSIAVSQANGFTINFSADLIHPKSGTARFSIGVTGPNGTPVTDARVSVVLSMPAHHHGPITVAATGGKQGEYVATTGLSPHMRGQWNAAVQITTSDGKSASQAFTFDQ